MSLFISFEGGEGTGKTTQAKALDERLQRAGVQTLLVREPGTTALGHYLRDWLKREHRRNNISHGAEVFLFAAARAELVAKILKPALSRSRAVLIIADRYADSTVAYQGYGRRVRLESVRVVNELATRGVVPKLTFLFDCPPEDGLKRAASAQSRLVSDSAEESAVPRVDEEGTRRFEEEPLEFHRRVRRGYLAMAKKEPHRWCVIDAMKPADEISRIVWKRVQEELSGELAGSSDDGIDLKLEPQG